MADQKSPDGKAKTVSKRGFGPQALARSVRRVAKQGAGKRPPLLTDLTFDWPGIVGEVIGSRTLPLKLTGGGSLPEGGRRPQTLVLKVENAWALEVNHQTPTLVERVNSYFGWRAIDRISLLQGYVPPTRRPAKKRPLPSPAMRREVADLTQNIQSEDLRSTLSRLGESVLARADEAKAEQDRKRRSP